MTTLVNQKFLRTAAVLYADDNQYVTTTTIHKKIIESVFLEVENQELTCAEIAEYSHKYLHLTLDESEIEKIVNKNTEEEFHLRYGKNSDEKIIQLSAQRYLNLQIKLQENTIDPYILEFINKNPEIEKTNVNIKDCIFRYVYELMNSNIAGFSKLTRTNCSFEDININTNNFTPEERQVINSFLNWDNDKKNKAIFSVISYSIEYCLISNHKDGGALYLQGIQNKIFHLDTNMIIRAIGINGDSRKRQINIFLKKCLDNGEQFIVSKYTVAEFNESIDHHIKQLQKLKFGRINPNLFQEYTRTSDIYHFYHKWRIGRANSGFDLFKAHIQDLYKKFLSEFNVKEEYKMPFDEKNEKHLKIISEYSQEIGSHKVSENKYNATEAINYSDAQNIFLIETKRGDNNRSITDTKLFFVSTDQSLRRWDFNRSTNTLPVVLLPSQWMSVLLKYISRSSDDYKSFVSFLNLKQDQPIIKSETLHIILAGISEMTEDFERQSSIVARMVDIKFDGIIQGETDEDIRENAKVFAHHFLEQEVIILKADNETIKETIGKLGSQKDKLEKELEGLKGPAQKSTILESQNKGLYEMIVHSKLRKWQRYGWLSLILSIACLVFIVLEFVALDWEYNYPAQIIEGIDKVGSDTRKNMFYALNGLLITGVSAFGYVFYRRLLNEEAIEEKKEKIFDKISKKVNA